MNMKESNNPYGGRLPNITTPHYESGGEKDNDEGSKSPRSSSQQEAAAYVAASSQQRVVHQRETPGSRTGQ